MTDDRCPGCYCREERIAGLEAELERLRQAVHDAANEIGALKLDLHVLEEERDEAQNRCTELSTQLDDANRHLASLERQLDDARQRFYP